MTHLAALPEAEGIYFDKGDHERLAGLMIKGWFKTDEGWNYLGEDGVYDALRSSFPFHDKIIRFFRKNYRFVKTIIRKTRGEKVSKKHGFKPFPSGLGLKTCFKFLHKKSR